MYSRVLCINRINHFTSYCTQCVMFVKGALYLPMSTNALFYLFRSSPSISFHMHRPHQFKDFTIHERTITIYIINDIIPDFLFNFPTCTRLFSYTNKFFPLTGESHFRKEFQLFTLFIIFLYIFVDSYLSLSELFIWIIIYDAL